MIVANNISKKYSNFIALSDVSLTIPKGSIYGIIGKSGAGKSTLLRLLSLLEQPDTGIITYNKMRVDNLSKNSLISQRRNLGMIFQNFNLFSSRDVFGNIAFPLEILPKSERPSSSEIASKVNSLISLVDLVGKEKSPISKLSGGQKQRVAIARALANNPEVLFCDEATSALDPQTTLSILKLLKDIQKQTNLTIVIITHQMEVVREICDYIAVISEGKIVESGSVRDVFSYPKAKATRELLTFLQPLDEREDPLSPIKSSTIYRLHFLGPSTEKPVISHLVRNFQVDVNILLANLRTVEETLIGELTVSITGEKKSVDNALAELINLGIKVERI